MCAASRQSQQELETAFVAPVRIFDGDEQWALRSPVGKEPGQQGKQTPSFLLGVGQGARAVPDAGTTLAAMFRAEAAKILVIVGGLWVTLSAYQDVVPAAFFTAFVITVIVFSMAFFVRD